MKYTHSFWALLLLVLAYACSDVSLTRSDSDYGYDYNDKVSTSGSLASFAISGDNLFTIVGGELRSYDISNPKDTVTMVQAAVEDAYRNRLSNLETIFPYGDHLFLGASDGMYIIDVTTPSRPKFVSSYEHVVSCDPVVVQGNTAYVTLRKDNRCWQEVNELQVVDITDLSKPKKIKSYPMESPLGLGVDGDLLFVCDNNKLKVMDCSDSSNIELVKVFDNITASDVIPYKDVLLVLGAGELRQYSYADDKLVLLSTITNKKK